MKLFVALFAVIAFSAVSAHDSKHIPILKYDSKLDAKQGSYEYGYETGNGIGVAERGQVKNLGQKEHEAMVSEGHFTFTDPKGQRFTVHYTADENGFRAQGEHLPTPPPVPAEIQAVWAKINGQHNSGEHGKW